MTDRYAFRYTEFKVAQIEQNKLFNYSEKNALLADIAARMTGISFIDGKSSLAFLGIRVDLFDADFENLAEDCTNYGVDAMRVVLLENKQPLTQEQKSAGWKLVDKLWLSLRDFELPELEQINQPVFYPFISAIQKKDWKSAWICLKTVLNEQKMPVCLFCLYPFMPHLVQSICFDIHSKMAGFWNYINSINVPDSYFIEVNGKKVIQFFPKNTDNFDKIKEEALSFTLIQKKIAGKNIKNVVHVQGKGLNFVV